MLQRQTTVNIMPIPAISSAGTEMPDSGVTRAASLSRNTEAAETADAQSASNNIDTMNFMFLPQK
ncbi:hypothetical protein [Xylophilus rhododendri]|uniref:hypothetical protein n=1 Tax=Xylophilus rhododendri TaxID=2697032 RepID=UPI001E296FC3|nr:hypothetical protein [Xylophilus rhododendri]